MVGDPMVSKPTVVSRFETSHAVAVAGVLVAITLAMAMSWVVDRSDYDLWGGLLVAPWLILASLPLLLHIHRTESDAVVAHLITAAFFAKLLGAYLRFHVVFDVYARGDANRYAKAGRRIAGELAAGNLPDLSVTGSRFIDLVTGVVFFFTNTSTFWGFLVFTWLAFLGTYLFYRAFVLSVEAAQNRRYAVAIFFLPTLLFWPSSIGKEAWMLFALGLAAYGIARVLSHRPGGYPVLLVGLAGAMLVRPHVAAIVCSSLLGAIVVARGDTSGTLRQLTRPALILVVGIVVLGQVNEFFDIDLASGDFESVETVLDDTDRRSGDSGGSVFENRPVRTPMDFPVAAATVLFRPWPSEAHNTQSLLTALEGSCLLLLLLLSLPRLWVALRRIRAMPYVAFSLFYVVLFIIAFSNIANFGILARQRAMLFPFLLVLVALPLATSPQEQPTNGTLGPGPSHSGSTSPSG